MKIGLKFTTILLVVFFALTTTSLKAQTELPQISVGEVANDIKLGSLAGNKNLAFGVKNIIEESLMDLGYPLVKDSKLKIKVRLLFFDVTNVGTNISVFHKGVATTQIIASSVDANMYGNCNHMQNCGMVINVLRRPYKKEKVKKFQLLL